MSQPLSATRVRILDATLSCVSYHGFRATTKEISWFAEVSPGTLFGYYPSKEQLLHAAQAYAVALLFPAGQDLPGDTVYAQLHTLWFRTATRALQHRDAFAYWALYQTTPDYVHWSTPAAVPLGDFEIVRWLVYTGTGARAEEGWRHALLLAWQWVAQWTAALQLARPLWLLGDSPGWPTQPLPTMEQVLQHAFETAWRSLGIPPQARAESPQAFS